MGGADRQVPIVTPTARPLAERFWTKVEKTETCWLWTGTLNRGGYGTFWDGERAWPAHRWAYAQLVDAIADGLVIDHLCHVRACVNPAHLEAVEPAENSRRQDTTGRIVRSAGPRQETGLVLPSGIRLSVCISLEEAAKRLGLSTRRCRQLVDAGVLRADKVGRAWITTTTEVERVAALHRPTGRPKMRRANSRRR